MTILRQNFEHGMRSTKGTVLKTMQFSNRSERISNSEELVKKIERSTISGSFVSQEAVQSQKYKTNMSSWTAGLMPIFIE